MRLFGKKSAADPPGFYAGKHYTEYVETVKQLKRDGHDKEAESLLLQLVVATEAEANVERWPPAPWYYEQLAILYRKHKNYAAEVTILERYTDTYRRARGRNQVSDALFDRLAKARNLLQKSQPSI